MIRKYIQGKTREEVLNYLFIIVLILITSAIGYNSSRPSVAVEVKAVIESLYYHGINKYTYTIKDISGEIITTRVPYKLGESDIRIFEDVEPDDSMWIKYSYDSHYFNGDSNFKSEIHIRQKGDITPSCRIFP